MSERVDEELALLRHYYPNLEYVAEGRWVRIPEHPLPANWNRPATDTVFQILQGHPGTPPYGIYVLEGLRYAGKVPENYTEPAQNQPPFDGGWALFSWAPQNGQWKPGATVTSGANLLNFARSFEDRFREGK